jgi:putative PIN family toxin of toxin-antitoxin system
LKIVLDTNVLFSGLFGKGPSKSILERWKDGVFLLVFSAEILREYLRVLKRAGFNEEDTEELTQRLSDPDHALLVKPSRHFDVIWQDPSDNMFLDCAVEAKADAIVSGDKHLHKLQIFEGIPILKPRPFLDKFFPDI